MLDPQGLLALKSRVDALTKTAIRLQAHQEALQREQQRTQLRLTQVQVDTLTTEKVLTLFNWWIDKLVGQHTDPIVNLVTEGFRAVFNDQDLEFGYTTAVKRDTVTVDFFVKNGRIKGKPLSSFGGGPATIASLLLRVFVLLRLKREKFLLLDESLKAISPEYIENTAVFLKQLAEKTGIDVLLVTHTDRQAYAELADHVWVGTDASSDTSIVTMEVSEVSAPS